MSAILVKIPPQIRRAEAPSDSPIAKPIKHGTREIDREERQDADHEEQLDGHEQQPHAHAGLEGDEERGERVAFQGRERGATVRNGVDPDAEPGDAIASQDSEDRREQDHDDPPHRHFRKHSEIISHANRDENPEHRQEFSLLKQVGLAGFPNDLETAAIEEWTGRFLVWMYCSQP